MKKLNKLVYVGKKRKECIIIKKNLNKKQILITGGVGFVGHHLIKKLVAKNYFPIIIDNSSNGSLVSLSKISKEKYIFVKADIRNLKKIKKTMSCFKPLIIIHLAALHFIPYCDKCPKEVLEVNLKGTENLLKIAEEFKINNFLFASTAAVYATSNRKYAENSVLKPIDIYGKSKKLAEKKIIRYSEKNPAFKFVILRLFNIFGYNDNTPHFIPEIIKKIKNSPKISVGNLETIRDYIFIDDVIDAIFRIMKKNGNFNNQIYNLGTGIGTSGIEIVKLVARFFKKELLIKQDKKLLRKVDRPKSVADIRKFSKKYNWFPNYNIEKGLKKLCEK